ncbi:MAG: hypothetical protein QOD53_2365 [Thermoleophilaceae bacterium]|jgi:GT2 family glycosyltransferase|nr:hypothetical protein [Thermoleophilaceae bacterium]
MTRVCAVVATHARRELLGECLDALRRQTHPLAGLVVVDNASTDGTREALAAMPDVRQVRLEANAGSAGGFAAGVRAALATDADWLWLMDDDAEPHRDALELLLASPAALDPAVAAVCSAVLSPDGEIDPLHRGFVGRLLRALPAEHYRPGSAPRLGFASYVGTLVRAKAARAAGPPRADMFTWGDDVEFSIRLRAHGELRLIPESRVLHKALMGGQSTPRSRFWNRVLGVSYPSAPLGDFWKQLHLVRNFVWLRYQHGSPGATAFVWIACAYAVKSLLYDDRPLRRLPWIFRAAYRGRRGRPLDLTPARWAQIARVDR